MTTTTTETIQEWAGALTTAAPLGEALGMTPCQTLEMAFPAIVGNGEILQALACLLDPAMDEIAPLVAMGIVPREAAEEFLHNLFHTLQIAAALGHMVGVDEALGVEQESPVPVDLSEIEWAELPDTFGEDSEEEA